MPQLSSRQDTNGRGPRCCTDGENKTRTRRQHSSPSYFFGRGIRPFSAAPSPGTRSDAPGAMGAGPAQDCPWCRSGQLGGRRKGTSLPLVQQSPSSGETAGKCRGKPQKSSRTRCGSTNLWLLKGIAHVVGGQDISSQRWHLGAHRRSARCVDPTDPALQS